MAKTQCNYLTPSELLKLRNACILISQAYDDCYLMLVGSCLEKPDFRDVDVRCIIPDIEFGYLFPASAEEEVFDARWSLLCTSISDWMKSVTGLPVDFQFQKMSLANERFTGAREALTIHASHGDARI
jgi:hypothetical protein